jgi:2-C-methyl-D-erythritol 4-phosphate cytidylyltransferase/2-C-methyl-D-erythritol 2,4-cyclodiphosphate synthase
MSGDATGKCRRLRFAFALANAKAVDYPIDGPNDGGRRMTGNRDIAVVIVAAGRGERAGNPQDGPKQYRAIGGRPVLARTIDRFAAHPAIGRIVVAIHRDDRDLYEAAVGDLGGRVAAVIGGASRQVSTLMALRALAGAAPDIVLIHDAVRPFADATLIDRVIAQAASGTGALPALPVTDTLKRRADAGLLTIDREGLHAAQTPQGFPFAAILEAHESAHRSGRSDFTDDASIAEWAGLAVVLVEGAQENVKLTFARDLEMADERLTPRQAAFPDVRTGNGYDVHAFGQGDAVMLCGVRIPHGRTLSGHSDADVGLHALTDALLATCGAGDIGTHFPPSEPQWRGAASRLFVEHAASLVRMHGGRIANVDVTLICEAPRIGPHREAMTAELSAMLGIAAGRISVKATTNERLGFVGREEGIAAIATASVVYPGGLPE